jgi:hypothetical protein
MLSCAEVSVWHEAHNLLQSWNKVREDHEVVNVVRCSSMLSCAEISVWHESRDEQQDRIENMAADRKRKSIKMADVPSVPPESDRDRSRFATLRRAVERRQATLPVVLSLVAVAFKSPERRMSCCPAGKIQAVKPQSKKGR